MVLDGVAAAASSIFQGAAAAHNWETDEVISHYFMGCRENKASQTFERQFQAIDFKIKLQELHREDLRDLVDLTTSRMEIYHIVGTLLLTFCIEWYTDNSILKDHLPMWFADLFLISNFAAVGYLILSVWLSMYASVASRSIGTRLLTSFARLSVPSRAEIQRIKVPIFFNVEDFFKRRILRRSDDVEAALDPRPSDEIVIDDDQQHFRRFLQELPQWLSYDTYARVCMSYGMNQMLQALSYYILGVIWSSSPMAAFTSFVAVKFLAMLVFWLDIGAHHDGEGWSHLIALAFLHFGPPLLAAMLLGATIHPWLLHSKGQTAEGNLYKEKLSACATLCLWGHAGSLYYLCKFMTQAGTSKGRFKPGDFANVLEWVQMKAARKDFLEQVSDSIRALQSGCSETMRAEETNGCVSVEARQSKELEDLSAGVVKACKFLSTSAPHPAKDAELERAEQALKRFELWRTAPRIYAALQSLQHAEVQNLLSRHERRASNEALQSFFEMCELYDMGIFTEPTPRDAGDLHHRSSVQSRALTAFTQAPRLTGLVLAEGETRVIRAQKGPGDVVWIDTVTGQVLSHTPEDTDRTTSFKDTVEVALPHWRSDLENLREVEPRQDGGTLEGSDADQTGKAVPCSRPTTVNGGRTPAVWTQAPEQEAVKPPDELPIRLVTYFTYWTIAWWVFAGFAHAIVVLTQEENDLQHLAQEIDKFEAHHEDTSLLQITWPAPTRLFKVDSIHCSDTQLWVSSRFSLYATAPKSLAFLENDHLSTHSSTLGTLHQVQEESAGAILCGNYSCNVLSPPVEDVDEPKDAQSRFRTWRLTSLQGSGHGSAAVQLPRTWRRVAGTWSECAETSSCQTAVLAGWDGSTIYFGNLRRDGVSGAWGMHTRYELDPRVGLCPRGTAGCALPDPFKYDDVRALQLTAEGRTLMVMLGGNVIDFWDLSKGYVRGRLHLDNEYSSMCQSGNKLLVSHHDNTGPLLSAVVVPSVLAELLRKAPLPGTAEKQQFNATDAVLVEKSANSENHDAKVPRHHLPSSNHRLQHFLGTSMVQRFMAVFKDPGQYLHEHMSDEF